MKVSSSNKYGPSFSKLSPQGQEAFLDVRKKTSRLVRTHDGAKYRVSDSLQRLLDDGKLEQTIDTEGDTLIKNLQDMVNSDQIGKTFKNEVIGWTATHLAYPEETFSQLAGKGTCAAATIAYESLVEESSEFVRIVDGLVSKERKVTLASGETLKRATRSLKDPYDRNSPVECIVQGSFMDFARPEIKYDIRDDEFGDSGDTGLYPNQVKRLASAVKNQDLKTDETMSIGSLKALLESPDGDTPAVVRWSEEKNKDGQIKHAHHMILITDVDDKVVHFRNPWGPDTTGKDIPPNTETLENGHQTIPHKDFKERLTYVVAPKDFKVIAELEESPSPSPLWPKTPAKPLEPVKPKPPTPSQPEGPFGWLRNIFS